MAFCKYSIEKLANNTTSVDNIFINNYLPYADATCVKVYLYGLYKCQDSSNLDNTLDHFAKELQMTEDEIEQAFSYWQDQGLVQILNVIPFEVRYLPLTNVFNNTRLYSESKYSAFNDQVQQILAGRTVTPNEYKEYYDIIENMHMEKAAMLLVIDFCVKFKSTEFQNNNSKSKGPVSYAYITSVAKDWASQGLLTAEQIKEKIFEMETYKSTMKDFVKTLKLKRALTVEEFELYKKWVVEEGFADDVINYVAKKQLNKPQYYIFQSIDRQLDKYYAQKLFTVEDIRYFEEEKTKSLELAKKIVKSLGLYYENLEPVIDNYVLNWVNLGFSEKMLEEISNYCFKTNVRTLEGMNKVLDKFHKLGILSEQALAEYINEVLSVDKKIKSILEEIGLSRNVNQFDRDKYKVWKELWNMPDDVIQYACTQAVGKEQPMQYLASIITSFHDKNIKTLEDAKNSYEIIAPQNKKSGFSTGRTYTREEMNSLFQSIDEIEI